MTAITWQSIQTEALRRIQSREWPPGAQIPHEADLAAELGCARATVNRALRELAKAGLLERRRKAGTRVPLNPVRKATFEIPIIRQDIEARGLPYAYTQLARETDNPPADIRQILHLPASARLTHVIALHSADGAPFCLEDRWINPATVPDLARADFTGISANEWLVQNAAFSGGDITFSATSADAVLAGRLGCPPGTALLTIKRTTWAGPAPITAVTLTYAPGHSLHTTI
ncbi:MAG: GntR family transcriptional regulator [Paracoccaceae bacterium]|nr:GntR family transcriptional regulator [Paracoccaceae bacterium]